ncbi:MAG: sulfatase-like hydrolase/transferase, partial [Verrucomicrobiota bacterium]
MTYSRILLFLILSVPLSHAGLTISAEPTANFSPKGKTKLAPGNAKGQTFALEKASQFEGVVLPISNLERASDLRLEVYATEGQTPTGKPLLSASGDFPENLPNKTSIQVTFAEPITLSPGSYALLIQSDDSKFQLPLNPSDPYPAGQFIRRNASTKEAWKPGATAATDLPLRLLGSTEFSIPLPSERTKAPETPKKPVTLTHHQNPEFTPISLASLPQKPNLIVCMVDDLGWNQIGVPQATWNTHPGIYETPNLARLAEEGLCFTAAYAQPNCAPTRAAMLSGQYPARIHNQVYVVNGLNRHGRGGISKDEAQFVGPNQEEDIAPEAVTIAEALKENGYATAHIGKYHVGGHEGGESTLPENVGFDVNIGGSSQGHQPTCFASESKDGEWQFKGLGRGHFDRFGSPYTTDYVENHGFSHSLVGTAKHVSDAVADAME